MKRIINQKKKNAKQKRSISVILNQNEPSKSKSQAFYRKKRLQVWKRNACKYTSFSKLFLLLPSLLKGGYLKNYTAQESRFADLSDMETQRNHPKSHLHKDGSDRLEFNLSRKYSQQNSVSINASSLHLISLRINVLAIEGW